MGITSTIGRATSKATSKLQKKSSGLALGLSKNKNKTIQVEVVQDKIRKAAKKAGTSIKKYRADNPNNANVKKLYDLKPHIKSDDAIRIKNRKQADTKQSLPDKKSPSQEKKITTTFKSRGRGSAGKQTEARKELLRDASKKARTFTGFERSTKVQPTAREVSILRKKWEAAGGKKGTGKSFTDIKKQYFGKFYEGK